MIIETIIFEILAEAETQRMLRELFSELETIDCPENHIIED
ncbi:hypothetical protein ACJENL_27280 [Escherichia coli]